MTAYMLDTNVFDRLLDKEVSIDAFRGRHLLATHVQLEELEAAKKNYPERAADLLSIFEEIDPKMHNTTSGLWDVSNWDQSDWSAKDGVVENMLKRLRELDALAGKKHRPKNAGRDVLIAHTAINIDAMLISDDEPLRQLVSEFGGRTIPPSDLRTPE